MTVATLQTADQAVTYKVSQEMPGQGTKFESGSRMFKETLFFLVICIFLPKFKVHKTSREKNIILT